jgi:hypothetical protein
MCGKARKDTYLTLDGVGARRGPIGQMCRLFKSIKTYATFGFPVSSTYISRQSLAKMMLASLKPSAALGSTRHVRRPMSMSMAPVAQGASKLVRSYMCDMELITAV